MFAQLIDQVIAAAQSIANDQGIPPEAQMLREDAQAFSQTLAPQLKQDIQEIGRFCEKYGVQQSTLNALLSQWKSGNNDARQKMLQILEVLSSTLDLVQTTNQRAFQNLSNYQNTIQADHRTITQFENQLNAQMSSLDAQMKAKRKNLEDTSKKLLAIAWFPIAWIIAEIANLADKKKLIEQEIVDLSNEMRATSQQYSNILHTRNTLEQLESTLQTIEGSLYNLVNGVNVADGQMKQVVGTLQHTEQGSLTVVVEAYLITLNTQVGTLRQYALG